MPSEGIPTYGLADDTAYPELFELLNRQRRRWGVTIIPWRNLREIFRIMRTPAALGMVVDWGYRPDDLPVRLFGAWTTLPAGPATLAARTRAIILPVAAMRQPDGTYRAIAREPIEVPDSKPATLQAATQRIADALEEMVRPAPDQWFTFKPMWPSTQAEAEALAARAAGDGRRMTAPGRWHASRAATAAPRLGQRLSAGGAHRGREAAAARCRRGSSTGPRTALGIGALVRAPRSRRRLLRAQPGARGALAGRERDGEPAHGSGGRADGRALDGLVRAAFGHWVLTYAEIARAPGY